MTQSSTARNPEVSVLMSCYNADRWLHEAIDSVLAQTFENFELILVDDGSTDESWSIIQSYSERDGRIVPISKKNTGLTDSLNVGIARARGVWIARLDADDLCEPTRLEEQIRYVRGNPQVVLLGTGFIEIDEQGQIIKKHLYPTIHRKLVRNLERMRRFIPHSSAIFRREVAQDAGCYNPVFRKTQDWDLWLRFAERGTIGCLQNCLVKVRRHSETISNSSVGVSQLVYGSAASVCHFIRVHGCSDPSANRDGAAWHEFLAWVNRRMTEDGVFERRKAWSDARADYLGANNGLTGALRFGRRTLQSGHASALVRERLIGSSLPERLAREWMERPCGIIEIASQPPASTSSTL